MPGRSAGRTQPGHQESRVLIEPESGSELDLAVGVLVESGVGVVGAKVSGVRCHLLPHSYQLLTEWRPRILCTAAASRPSPLSPAGRCDAAPLWPAASGVELSRRGSSL